MERVEVTYSPWTPGMRWAMLCLIAFSIQTVRDCVSLHYEQQQRMRDMFLKSMDQRIKEAIEARPPTCCAPGDCETGCTPEIIRPRQKPFVPPEAPRTCHPSA